MRFLLDVCASYRILRSTLVEAGHDVASVADVNPQALDSDVLAMAVEQDRILLTEDKDFGELVFVRGLPHKSIVRLTDMDIDSKVTAILMLIERHSDALLAGSMVVVTRDALRIRETRP